MRFFCYSTLLFCLGCTIFSLSVSAQERRSIDTVVSHMDTPWYQMMGGENPNVLEVQQAYRDWFRDHPFQKSAETRVYKRWMQKHGSNIDAYGNILPMISDPEGTQRFLRHNNRRPSYSIEGSEPKSSGSDSPWTSVGPFTWDHDANYSTSYGPGLGVVYCVAVDLTNPDKVYIGTEMAGIWVSKDGGETWREATAGMLVMSVDNIKISKTNPSVVYAGTNVGVIKSIDGGETWNYTSLTAFDRYAVISKERFIAVSPTSSDVVLRLSQHPGWPGFNRGEIYRSEDGGETWDIVHEEGDGGVYGFWGLEFHPTNPMIVYALAKMGPTGRQMGWLRSTDGGRTFSLGASGLPDIIETNRIRRAIFAVTPADPDRVGLLVAGSNLTATGMWGYYISRDAGRSFTHECCGEVDGPEPADSAAGNPNLIGAVPNGSDLGQVAWCMALAISDIDTNVVAAAGIWPWFSSDAGKTWTQSTRIHGDVQCMVVIDGTIWMATDGGIYRSDDGGATISNMSHGINGLDIWGYGQPLKRPDLMAFGAWHTGTYIRDDSTYSSNGYVGGWSPWVGGDATTMHMNPVDDFWMYFTHAGFSPESTLRTYRSLDKRVDPTFEGIDIGLTVLADLPFHPQLYYTMVAADPGVPGKLPPRFAISRDNGDTWQTLKTFTRSVEEIQISFSNPNWMYGIGDGKFWMTGDGGVEWVERPIPLSLTVNKKLHDVVIDDKDERTIWVAFAGIQNDRKVIRSTDGGKTWEDYSGSLPVHQIFSMVHQRGSDGGVYIGTHLGVYYRNNSMDDWELHGIGMPAAQVRFLQVNYTTGKLRAATSRGVWECDLFEETPPAAQIAANRNFISCSRNNTVQFACGSAHRYGPQTRWTWSFPGGTPSTSMEENPQVIYSTPGQYGVTLTIEDQFGSSTQTLENFVTVSSINDCEVQDVAGLAADFSGPDDYVDFPKIEFELDEVTFSVWVKPNGIQSEWTALFMSETSWNTDRYGFGFKNEKNELQYHWNNQYFLWSSGLYLPPDEWSHVALTVTPDGATFYLNGVPSHHAAPHGPMVGAPARLGSDPAFRDSRNFNGQMDEFRMYRRALSQDEIRRLMHLTASPSEEDDLVHYYQFNEPIASEAYDLASARDGFYRKMIRVPSTAPVSGGTVHDAREFGSPLSNFSKTDLSLGLSSEWTNLNLSNAHVVTWRLRHAPDSLPENLRYTNNQYWIVRAWDIEEPLPAVDSMIFSQVGTIGAKDARTPSGIKLYRRDANAHLNDWGNPVGSGISVDNRSRSITFGSLEGGVSTYLGQFIINMTDTFSVVGCEVQDVAGLAADFSGSEDYIDLPPIELISDEVTFSTWVKPSTTQSSFGGTIFMAGKDLDRFGFGLSSTNDLEYYWGAWNNWHGNSGLNLPADEWSHVALSITPERATLYLNGVASHHAAEHVPMTGDRAVLGNNPYHVIKNGRNFNGQLDEFRVYSRALSQDEIRKQMHLTATPIEEEDLEHYYQFNEAIAARVCDAVSSHNGFSEGVTRVPSTAPVSGGAVHDTREFGSLTNFSNTSLTLGLSPEWTNLNVSDAHVVTWRLRHAPDSLPANLRYTNNQYWIVRTWRIEEPLPAIDSIRLSGFDTIDSRYVQLPSGVELYRRSANAHLNDWVSAERRGIRVDRSTQSITFSGVAGSGPTQLGQFIIDMTDTSTSSIDRTYIGGSTGQSQVERLYPNPTGPHLNIIYRALSGQTEVLILLHDNLGREVQRKVQALTPGTRHGLILNMEDLPEGVYHLSIGKETYAVVK